MRQAAKRVRSGGQDALVDGEFSLARDDFAAIAAMLRVDAGIHLVESKATLVYSRLARRVRALGLPDFSAYRRLVESDAGLAERREMLSALTTNVTRFHREPHHFEHLGRDVLPGLLERARRGGRVRLWSAACSTGQEAYSIALTLLGREPNVASLDVRILATDIDPQVVETARRGVYPDAALTDAPTELRRRYFKTPNGAGWEASEELLALISFRTLNLNAAWPMRGQFDVIFCRNVVIYFDEPTQQALWRRFAAALPEGGHLYIGHSERLSGPAASMFDTAGVTTHRRNGAAAT